MEDLLTPNLNFIPGSPRDLFLNAERSALRWDMEELDEVALAAGYDGIKLHDSRVFKHSRQLNAPEEAQQLGRLIITGHESWVGTADPQPRDSERARTTEKVPLLVRLGSRVLFPDGPTSLENLKTLEEKLGRPLDVVAFPNIHGDPEVDRYKSGKFLGQVAIQPTIDRHELVQKITR